MNMAPLDPLLIELHRKIEQAALPSEVNEQNIRQLCTDAVTFDMYAVVVNPVWVKFASGLLGGKRPRVVSVAGFPLGANRTDIKVAESVEAIEDGAHEIDMVANVGWIVSGLFGEVETEIRKLRRQLPAEVALKVIIEANKLTPAQQTDATNAVINGGAQFVKTGTGFFGGATVEEVKRLAETAKGQIQVKASGGIKSVEDCQMMLAAGASRIGTSSGPAILRQLKQLSD